MTLTTRPGGGKTEVAIRHIADLGLGTHKGGRRVWLQGKRLASVGFKAGVRYRLDAVGGGLVLRLSPAGDHKVSHKGAAPVVDLITQAFPAGTARVQVRFADRAIVVDIHPNDRMPVARLARLNARLAAAEPLRLGSVSHGGGVASDALLRGLGASTLAFAVDINGDYIEQSLGHGPLARGGVSIEADLGDVDPAVLPQAEVLEAGLPCVAASRAGRSKKHLRQAEDDEQVADLAAAFCEVVRAVQPAVIVLENVPEYATSASAALIRRRLGRWGYVLHERVIDGLAWSIENRQRWIMVAVTRGLDVDLDALVGGDRPGSVAEVLDRRTPAAAWRKAEHLAAHEARHAAAGNGFARQLLTPASTSVPVLRRSYQKAGTTDPRLVHPTRPGYSRIFSPSEHARIKGISPALVEGLSDKVAHQVLGQSVIAPAFTALGRLIGGAVR